MSQRAPPGTLQRLTGVEASHFTMAGPVAGESGLVPVVHASDLVRRLRPRPATSASPLASALALAVLACALVAPAEAGHQWYATLLTIDPESLRKQFDKAERPLPIDVRPAEAFQRGRLPGARSLPLAALRERVDEIPRQGLIVLYGAGRTPDVNGAYQFLRGRGYANVFVLEDGIAGWQARGYPLER
jgi:rhodanese-related sulfurtransferase